MHWTMNIGVIICKLRGHVILVTSLKWNPCHSVHVADVCDGTIHMLWSCDMSSYYLHHNDNLMKLHHGMHPCFVVV